MNQTDGPQNSRRLDLPVRGGRIFAGNGLGPPILKTYVHEASVVILPIPDTQKERPCTCDVLVETDIAEHPA